MHECVFGMDGANRFGFQVDYCNEYWRLPGLSIHAFEEDGKSENRKIGSDEPLNGPDKRNSACAGLNELTEVQTQELERFLKTCLISLSKYPRAISQTNQYMNKDLDELLEAGMVEPSENEWFNPIVMVTKSKGTYRMCLDFREVNGSKERCIFIASHGHDPVQITLSKVHHDYRSE